MFACQHVIQYNELQYYTVQHNTMHYNTTYCNTILYNIITASKPIELSMFGAQIKDNLNYSALLIPAPLGLHSQQGTPCTARAFF